MDRVFNLTLVICSLLFVLVVGLMVLFVVRYRRRPGKPAQKSPSHNLLLETDVDRHSGHDCLGDLLPGVHRLHEDADRPRPTATTCASRPSNGPGSSSIPTDTSMRTCTFRPASPCG